MADKKIIVDFGANFNKFYSEFSQAKKKTEDGLTSLKRTMLNIGAAYAVGNFLKGAVEASNKQAIAEAKVARAVTQTGAAAGYSTAMLKKMANELQGITGIGDEEILNDVSLQLLTFGNISGDTFKRAQVAAMDLAAVIGTDLRSQTIQLGKALDDPIKGITALRRAGVMFSDTQMKIIQGYVQHNDVAKAQKLILDEIESKYGGQAKAMNEATHGVMAMNAAWGDTKEAVGNTFGPLLSKILPEVTKGLKGIQIILNGFDAFGAVDATKNERQGSYYESVKDLSPEQIMKERIALDAQKKELLKLGTAGSAYKSKAELHNVDMQIYSLNEMLKVLIGIDKFKEQAAAKDKPRIKTLTEEEIKEAEKAAKEKSAALKKYFDEVKFYDNDYWKFRQDAVNKEIEEMKSAGLKNVDFKKYETEKKKEIDKEYIDWLKNLYGGKATFDENGQISGGAVLGTDMMAPGKLKGKTTGQKPELDLGSPEQIMGEWISGSELASNAYGNFMSEASNLTKSLQFQINDTMSFGTRAVLGFANAAIDALTSVIAKWAVLNMFSAMTGGGGIGLAGMLGFAGGGTVLSNRPSMVGERGPELFMPSTNGYIVSNNNLKSAAASGGGFDDSRMVNALQGIQRRLISLENTTAKSGNKPIMMDSKKVSRLVSTQQSSDLKGNYNNDR